MALLNFLFQGSYSIVDGVFYSKHQCFLRFTLRIFADASKSIELANRQFEIGRYCDYRALSSTPYTEPPDNYQQGVGYLVGINATGPWEGRDKLIAVSNETDVWSFWSITPTQIFYNPDTESYFKLNLTTLEPETVYPMDDYRIWDRWFASGVVFSETSNLFAQAYLFLKSRPGFESVQDG